MANQKMSKRTTPQTGDVHVTTNYRLKKYNKKNESNKRMAVLMTKEKLVLSL